MKTRLCFLIIIVTSLIFSSCGSINQDESNVEPIISTPIPEDESVDTDTIEPTSEPVCNIQSDLKTSWETIFCEEFNDNSWEWYTGADISDLRTITAELKNGKYVVDITGNAHSSYLSGVVQWFYVPDARNFMITVDGEIESHNRDISWGINFLGNGDSFYSFGITKEGRYYLDMLEEGDWITLISSKSNKAINWDESNNISIVVDGDKFMFYINDTLIDSYESDLDFGDYLAVFVQLAEGASAEFTFDNILVRSND